MLLVDGHKSLRLRLNRFGQRNSDSFVHTTHMLQPLDVSMFKSLKALFARSL